MSTLDILKILVIGEVNTGKTSLINNFYAKKKDPTISTIGIDFRML